MQGRHSLRLTTPTEFGGVVIVPCKCSRSLCVFFRSSKKRLHSLERVETFLRINLKPWDFTSNPHGDLTAY